jgi:three-Cys-motif partner protein
MRQMTAQAQQIRTEDDGLACPEVGRWAEDKYRLVQLYDELFSTGMKNKWAERVYIDLYAAAGFARVRNSNIVLKGSPILALTTTTPFDKYIFCEEQEDLLDALRTRTGRIAPEAKVVFVLGSCNERVDEILAEIPRGTTGHRVLSLCLVDPFDFGLKFTTLKRLSAVYIDFVVLLAIGMDANRNYEHYVEGDSPKIDEALGNTSWRDRWRVQGFRRGDFRQFLAGEFSRSMETLGFKGQQLSDMKSVRSDERNLPLYHIALFSKHETAYKFWADVLKYSTNQPGFSW